MLRRHKSSSGEGLELSAAYAPAKPRRKRQEKHAAAAARYASLPQANAMFMATVAPLAPPQQQLSSTSTRSYLQTNRTVRPAMNQHCESRQSSSTKDRFDSEILGAEFDEREETPRRRNEPREMPLKEKLMQESSAFIQEKLLYDELLRCQRSRAENMAKLFGFAQYGNEKEHAKKTEGDTFQRAAGFREEWRIGRENEILDKLKCKEEQASNNADETKNRILREHFKRSIHTFLTTDLPRVPNADPTRSTQTKRSQDLLYAQQMDRILSKIETQQPFAVMNQAILEARSRFQSLLSRDTPLWNVQNRCEPVPVEPNPSSENVRIEEPARPELLQLYENVMEAKRVAKSTAVETKMPNKSSTVVVLEESNPKFLADLQQQRAKAEYQQNEIQARYYFRLVSVKRVQRSYRKYREKEWQRKKTETLERIARAQAARVLQLRLPILYRQYQFLRRSKLAFLRKHQGARIAVFCFWKHVYWRRCGFAEFQFDRVVDEALLKSIVRIQSFARQVKARREIHLKRSIVSLRSRRTRAKEWRTLHAFGMLVKPIDIDLVEWRCRISIEKTRVRDEIAREESRFVLEWKKYDSKLQKEVMKSKLPLEWSPQIDPISGEEYFLNTKTAKTSKEHPNKVLFNQISAKQRTRAEEIYAGQIKRLEDYQQRLDEQLQEHLRGSLDEILADMISGRVRI